MKATGVVFKSRQYVGDVTPPDVYEDESRYGNDGVFSAAGEPTWVKDPCGLWVLSFDGSNDWVSIPLHDALITPTQGTIVAWFKHTVDDNKRLILGFTDKDTSGENEIKVMTNSLQFISWRTHVGGVTTQELRTPQDIYQFGDWVCAVFAGDGSTIYIDVNGVNQTLDVATGSNNGDWMGDAANLDTIALGSLRRPTPEYGNYVIGRIIMYNYYMELIERQAIFQAERHWYGV